jgi:pimeloyl-ACP methyl ester carboxylesterase
LADLAQQLGKIPVLQIHGPLDPLDATGWLSSLGGPHRLVILPDQGHFFGDAGPELQKALVTGADWLIGESALGGAP